MLTVQEQFQTDLDETLDQIRNILLEKNISYGDSALSPIRIFAKNVSALEQIHVRIDDKLSRIAHGTDYENEDTVLDLIGYLIIKKIGEKRILRNM